MNIHPIQAWDQLLQAKLHPAALLQTAPAIIDGYLATAKELKEGIQMQLLQETLNKSEEEIEILVIRYQMVSGGLINLLFEYRQCRSATRELKQFYLAVSTELEAILMLLQSTCGGYFDYDLPLPLPLRFRKGWALKDSWRIIAGKLKDTTGNLAIVKILDRYVKELRHLSNKTALTYHQANYLQTLVKELSDHLSRPVYTSLTELLISWDFNEFAFLQEVCRALRTEVDNKKSNVRRLEYLRYKRKEVGQIPEKRSTGFHSEQDSAKHTIFDWIEDEVVFLEDA